MLHSSVVSDETVMMLRGKPITLGREACSCHLWGGSRALMTHFALYSAPADPTSCSVSDQWASYLAPGSASGPARTFLELLSFATVWMHVLPLTLCSKLEDSCHVVCLSVSRSLCVYLVWFEGFRWNPCLLAFLLSSATLHQCPH